jgi:hypothetical protein
MAPHHGMMVALLSKLQFVCTATLYSGTAEQQVAASRQQDVKTAAL